MHEPRQNGSRQALAAIEARQLRTILPRLIGTQLLQVGPWAYRIDHLDSQHVRDVYVAGDIDKSAHPDFCFDGHHLPIASNCMDIVALPHSLEHCSRPRQLLREADRVLCERGQLVMLGFNPLHPLMFMRQAFAPELAPTVGSGLYTARRICDWLELLDFDIVHHRRYGIGLPYLPWDGVDVNAKTVKRLPAIFSQAFMLVARKRIMSLTPLRQSFRQEAELVGPKAPAATSGMNSQSEIA